MGAPRWDRPFRLFTAIVLTGSFLLPETGFSAEKKITVQGVIRRTGSTGTDALVNNASASITLSLNHCTSGYSGTPSGCTGYSVANTGLTSADTTVVIKNGAFSVSVTPSSSTILDMTAYRGDDWYVVINGELDPFASGSVSEFPIRLEAVPFAVAASTAVDASNSIAIGGITVNATGIANGQVLKYDSGSNTFVVGNDETLTGASGGVAYGAGNGIVISGGTISVDSAKFAALTTAGKVATSSLPTITNALLGASAVTSTNLAADSINTAHIADSQVTDAKIASVDGSKVSGSLSIASITASGTLRLPVGTLAAPALQFGNTGTGLYSDASNLNLVKDGVAAFSVQSYGANVQGALTLAGSGSRIKDTASWATAAAPFISSADDKSGLYFPAAGIRGLVLATANADRLRVTSGGAFEFPGMTANRALYLNASTQLTTSTATGTQLGYLANVTSDIQAQISGLASGGSFVAKAGDTMTGNLNLALAGVSTNPALRFGTVPYPSGLYIEGVTSGYPNIVFQNDSQDGARQIKFADGRIQAYNGGNATFPTYAVSGGAGLFTPNNGSVSISSGSSERMRFSSDGTIRLPGVTSGVLYTDASGNLAAQSAISSTELSYLDNVTANIQTQINAISSGGASSYVAKSGDTMSGALTLANGAVATPSLKFAGSGSLGWYWNPTSAGLSLAVGGSDQVIFNTGGRVIFNSANSANYPLITLDPNGDTGTATGLYRAAASAIGFSTAGTERLRITSGGTITATATVSVTGSVLVANGQIASNSASGSTNAVDFNSGNVQSTSYDCTGTIALSNLRDGGAYTLIVTDTTSNNQCNFSSGADAVNYPPGFGARTLGKKTVYTFVKVGTDVFVSWIKGY